MCGIGGAILLQSDARPVTPDELLALGARMPWRGPDDEGYLLAERGGGLHLFGGPVTSAETSAAGLAYSPAPGAPDPAWRGDFGFAFRRLAILDLSPAGHQPMCDPSGRYWIVFNGEIYNYVELRAQLSPLGHRFATGCDTEVLLAAWTEWGEAMLERLNGMWGLAIWDAKERVLFAARDRFGVKPFYYRVAEGRMTFASELKPLVLGTARAPSLPAIHALLARDWVDHRPETFFEGVLQLPAGHCLRVAAAPVGGNSAPVVRRWWDFDPTRRLVLPPGEAVEQFRALFDDAVKIRLRADVPVGTCLSGGLDSTSIAVTAAGFLPHALRTFSVSYDEGPAFDERAHVKTAALAAHADAMTIVPDGSDLWDALEDIVWHQEEPAAGPGLYSQWHVMKLAGRGGAGMKVLLDGQGGDELLAGYHRYYFLYLRDLLARGQVGAFLRDFWGVAVGQRLGLAQSAAMVARPFVPRGAFDWARRTFGQGKDRVLGSALAPFDEPEPMPPRRFARSLSDQLAWDMTARFLPSLLRYEDRNAMAFSIETRLPFLDYRLAEFVFALADERRIEGVTTKAILREALATRVPPSILARRDKMGYETPTDVWLRGREKERLRATLLDRDARSAPYLDRAELAHALDDYLAGRRAIGLQVWRWLHLELWLRQFFDVDGRAARA
jgi:asparagine synthase (glutamine-hydrolysing)